MSKAKGPLCKVCGDEASGFHYGVDSCEGCKGFFRRCITQGMTHRCSNEEKCDMTPFTRNSCQYCRLKKCFAVGMSREASRLGRRPKRMKQDASEPTSPRSAPIIAPYPQLTQLQISKLSMEELQRLLHAIQAGKAPIPAGMADVLKSETTTIPGVTIKEEHVSQPPPLPVVSLPEGTQLGEKQHVGIPFSDSPPQQASQAAVVTSLPENIQASQTPQILTVSPTNVQQEGISAVPKSTPQPSHHMYRGSIPGGSAVQSTSNILPDNNAGERHMQHPAAQFSAQTSGDYESGYSSGHGGDTPSSASSSSHSPIGPTPANQVPSAQHHQQHHHRPIPSPDTGPPPKIQHMDQLQPHGQRYAAGETKGMTTAYQQVRFPNLHMEHSPDSLNAQRYQNPSDAAPEMDTDQSHNYLLSMDNTDHISQGQSAREGQYLDSGHLMGNAVHIKQEQPSPQPGEDNHQTFPASPPVYSPGHPGGHPSLVQIKSESSPSQCQMSRASSKTPPSVDSDGASSNNFPDSPPQRSTAPKNSLGSFGTLMVDAQQTTKGEKVELLASVMETIVEAHMTTCNFTIPRMQEGMMVFEAKKEEMEQHLGTMLANIDKDPGAMWSKMVDNMVPAITRTVTFSKRLPGFDELTQQDQIKLIKQGSFEVVFIRYTRCFQDDGMFLPSMEFKVPRNVVRRMPMGSFFMELFNFADVFNLIGLTDAEIALLSSTMIMNADRIGLTNRHAVYKLQGLFLQCLFQYMKKMRPESYFEVFNKTLMMMPELREINETHAKHLNSMKMSMPGMNMPELHEEVFNGKLD